MRLDLKMNGYFHETNLFEIFLKAQLQLLIRKCN